MEFEFIKEEIKKDRGVRNGIYAPIIDEWLETDNKTLKFKCKSEKEMAQAYGAVYSYRKAANLDYTIFKKKGSCELYLIKA